MKKQTAWYSCLFIVLLALVVLSVVITVSIGSTDLSFRQVYSVLYDHLFCKDAGLNAGLIDKISFKIIWQIRLPRTIFALLVGAGLSISGAAMQSLVLNPIADPYILGVSSGASAGAALAVIPSSVSEKAVILTFSELNKTNNTRGEAQFCVSPLASRARQTDPAEHLNN